MNFLEYSNKTRSNIIPKAAFESLVHEVFGVIAENISKSLGPLGSSATILDGMMTEATKDGFSIFKSYRFHNRYMKMVYNLIKAPCTRMNNTVGDGTTTAIVMANFLFQLYKAREYELDKLYRLPRQFTCQWDTVIKELTEKINSYSEPLDPKNYDAIYNLSYVTSNGDQDISRNMAETYAKNPSPHIIKKYSPTNKSYISPITGFEFPANLIDRGYARSEDLSLEEKNICVMIFDHKIESEICTDLIIRLNDLLKAMGKKLLVLAPLYDTLLCDTTLKKYMNQEYSKYGTLNLILGQYPLAKLKPYQLADLATVLRTWVINQDLASEILKEFISGSHDMFLEKVMEDKDFQFYGLLGTADTALLSCTNGSIFRVNDIENDEGYCDALRAANKELANILATTDYEKQSYAAKIYEANSRISQLEMQNYIYYIGADSDLQKKIIWDSVDDVIKCVRSAIKSGIVPGCQLSIIRACADLMNESIGNLTQEGINELPDDCKLRLAILQLIRDAVLLVYSSVLHGPDGRGMSKLIPLWKYVPSEGAGAQELKKEAENKVAEVIRESISKNQVFDLESLQFNGNIITSTETDTMVLMASSELIKILISGNQCVFLDSEVNDDHMEEVEVYT